MDIGALKTAIATRFSDEATFSAALTGGLHWGKGRQNPTYPYAVYFEIANAPVYTFTEVSEVPLFQFSIFDHNPDDPRNDAVINDLFTKLTNCFDLCDLTVSGYSHTWMIRGIDHEMQTEDDVLQHTVEYSIRIQKSR